MSIDFNKLVDEIVSQKLRTAAEQVANRIVEQTLGAAATQPVKPVQENLPFVFAADKPKTRIKRPRPNGQNALISNAHKSLAKLPGKDTILYRVFTLAHELLESGPSRRVELTKTVADLMNVEVRDVSRHMTHLIERGLLTVVKEQP